MGQNKSDRTAITCWDAEGHPMHDSSHGRGYTISYLEWCHRECARMRSIGAVCLVAQKNGMCAVVNGEE